MTDITKEYIERLVQKSQKGDEKSFSELFEIFFEKITRYISFRTEQHEVEDLVSDIFVKVVEKLKTYEEKTDAGFNAWIFRIAHNTVIDFYRKKKELLGLDDEENENIFMEIKDESPTPDEETNHILNRKKMLEILKTLPAKQREILELKYLEDFSNWEISKITGLAEGNIRIIQLRALQEIRKRWEKE